MCFQDQKACLSGLPSKYSISQSYFIEVQGKFHSKRMNVEPLSGRSDVGEM